MGFKAPNIHIEPQRRPKSALVRSSSQRRLIMAGGGFNMSSSMKDLYASSF